MTNGIQSGNSHYMPSLALLLTMAVCVLHTVDDVLMKLISENGPDFAVLGFLHMSFAWLAIVGYAIATRDRGVYKTHYPVRQIVRSIIVAASSVASLFAVLNLPLATSYTISFSTPIVTILMGWFILTEKPGWISMAAVLTGFAGVLVVVQPGAMALTLPVVMALLRVFGAALGAIYSRVMVRDSTLSFSFYAIGFSALGLLPFAWDKLGDVSFATVLGCAAIGIMGALANQLAQVALRYSPFVGFCAPVYYTKLIMAAGASYVVWGMIPDAHMMMGGALIVAAGLMATLPARTPAVANQNMPHGAVLVPVRVKAVA